MRRSIRTARKVLIISPVSPVWQGGSPRVLGLAKYLPEFGWQPIILTPRLAGEIGDGLTIVETDYRDVLAFFRTLFRFNAGDDVRKQVRKRLGVKAKKSLLDFFLTRIGEVVNYPDPDKGWRTFAVEAGARVIAEQGVEAMISSSAPVTAHIVARQLKNEFKIPWAADLRDPWSQNHNYPYSPLRRLIDRNLETSTLARADAVVTVCQPWADKLGQLHGHRSVYSITNGFDPREMNIPPASLTPEFSVTYTGTIYRGKQDISKLFAALSECFGERTISRADVHLRLYCSEEGWVAAEIEKYGLAGVARQFGLVPRETVVKRQRESQVLLQLNWEGPEQAGYSGKLFEYLAAQRPIVATGSGNDMSRALLEETGAGEYAPTVKEIKAVLQRYYQEYESQGKVGYRGDPAKADKYSHREMAGRFSEVLKSIAG